jgi:hypothetical protein
VERAVATGVAVAAWLGTWLATYHFRGPSFSGGGVGYLRLALALGVGFAIPRPWTPLLALAVPLAAIGLPSDDELVAAVLTGTVVAAVLILAGILVRLVVRRVVAGARHRPSGERRRRSRIN